VRRRAVYHVTLILGLIVSAAGLVMGFARSVREGFASESLLLVIGAVCLIVAALIHAAETRARVDRLQAEILEKEGYRHFVDRAAEGFFRIAPNGEILEINAAFARIYGYDSKQILRATLTEYPQDIYVDLASRKEFWSQLRAQGRVEDFISKVRRRDGKTIWISENARAILDKSGALLYCEGTVHDITVERESLQATRKALQDAQEAARAKAAFIAAMSHELKTPLNAVLGFSDLMLNQLCGPIDERYRSYLADIHANGKRLLDLICDVIDFARIEGQALTLSEGVFPIDKAIEEAREKVRDDRKDTPRLIVKTPEQTPFVRGDQKRLAQAIANVLANAVKFTSADGTISVKAYRGPDGSLLIEIADSGIGMPADRIERALEPFRQIDESMGRRYEGLGLGLPLAHALIRLHGGRLAIASTVGKGTTVNIALPPERIVAAPDVSQQEPNARVA